MSANIYRNGWMNQYEITKSNRYGYGNVFNPRYPVAQTGISDLAEPSGRWGCLVLGTRPSPGTIEESYCTVYYWANKDANGAFPYVPLSESYLYADIAAVFNVYIAGARSGECPEYFPLKDTNGAPINKTTVDYKKVVDYIVKRIPTLKKYVSPAAFVQTVFYTAGDQYRKDTKSIRPDIIWPASIDSRDPGNPIMNEWYDKRQQEVVAARNKDGVFSGVNDLLSNILTLVVVGTAIYLVAPLVFSRK